MKPINRLSGQCVRQKTNRNMRSNPLWPPMEYRAHFKILRVRSSMAQTIYRVQGPKPLRSNIMSLRL